MQLGKFMNDFQHVPVRTPIELTFLQEGVVGKIFQLCPSAVPIHPIFTADDRRSLTVKPASENSKPVKERLSFR